jgi:methionyl-tRNA formyltransferase
MRVIVAGQKWFGCETLKLCARLGCHVVQVAAPEGDRLHRLAEELNLPWVAAGEFTERTMRTDSEVIVCAHHHGFITPEMRARTTYGALGYHPSLLPRHRGRDAVEWAVRFGDPITGGTVYWMDDRADGGPIAAQQAVHILRGITAAELWRTSLAPLGLKLFEQVLRDLHDGQVVAVPQDEAAATWEPALTRRTLKREEAAKP